MVTLDNALLAYDQRRCVVSVLTHSLCVSDLVHRSLQGSRCPHDVHGATLHLA